MSTDHKIQLQQLIFCTTFKQNIIQIREQNFLQTSLGLTMIVNLIFTYNPSKDTKIGNYIISWT